MKPSGPRDAWEVKFLRCLGDHRQLGKCDAPITPVDVQSHFVGISHRQWHERGKDLADDLDSIAIPGPGLRGVLMGPTEEARRAYSGEIIL